MPFTLLFFAVCARAAARPQGADLSRAISLREYAVSARQLCSDLGKAAGVELTCDARLKGDLVILAVRDRPAREVMDRIGTTFGWEWRPTASGFRLTPGGEFVRKAHEGRRAILLREGHRLQTVAMERLRQARKVDSAAIGRELDRLQERQGSENPLSEAGRKDREKIDELDTLTSGWAIPLYKLIGSLTDDQLFRLATETLSFSSDPGPLQYGLSSSVCPHIAKADIATFTLGGDWKIRLMTAGHEIVEEYTSGMPTVPPAAHPPMPESLRKILSEETEPGDFLMTPENVEEPLSGYAAWLIGIAERAKVNLVADAYDFDPSFPLVQGTVEEALAPIGFTMGDGWLSARAYDWPRWREEQVPRTLLRSLNRCEEMELDDQSELISQLTPAQLESPLCPVDRVRYRFSKFWLDMPVGVREVLERGGRVPLDRLPNSAVSFIVALTNANGIVGGTECSSSLGEEPEVNAETPVVRPPEDSEIPHPKDDDFVSLYPRALAPGAALSMETYAFPLISFGEDSAYFAPSTFANFERQPAVPGQETFAHALFRNPARLSVATVRQFRFLLDPVNDQSLLVSSIRRGTRMAKTRGDLPADFLRRVAFHERSAELHRMSRIGENAPGEKP